MIRGNCAQVCLQLELFKDAYEHADECLHLDPDSAKVHVNVKCTCIYTCMYIFAFTYDCTSIILVHTCTCFNER